MTLKVFYSKRVFCYLRYSPVMTVLCSNEIVSNVLDHKGKFRVVLDSARRFQTIFAKMRPIDQKKGSGTIRIQSIV